MKIPSFDCPKFHKAAAKMFKQYWIAHPYFLTSKYKYSTAYAYDRFRAWRLIGAL